MHRFYHPAPLETGAQLDLRPEAAAQVSRVLRLRVGARIAVFNGDGREFEAALESVGIAGTSARILEASKPEVELSCWLHVAIAVLKGEKLDWTVQKLTELGASKISLVQTERTIVTAGEERWAKRIPRLRRIAEEAAEQSGRVSVPEVCEPIALRELLAARNQDVGFFLDPGAPVALREALDPCPDRVLLLLGPEGGFTQLERERAAAADFRAVGLGRRVLRAETAALAAATLVAAAAEAAAGFRLKPLACGRD